MRYFAVSSAIYKQVRATLDGQFGHPIVRDGRTITESCLPAAGGGAILANDGRVLVPLNEEFLLLGDVQSQLAGLLHLGAVEELTEAAFTALRT